MSTAPSPAGTCRTIRREWKVIPVFGYHVVYSGIDTGWGIEQSLSDLLLVANTFENEDHRDTKRGIWFGHFW